MVRPVARHQAAFAPGAHLCGANVGARAVLVNAEQTHVDAVAGAFAVAVVVAVYRQRHYLYQGSMFRFLMPAQAPGGVLADGDAGTAAAFAGGNAHSSGQTGLGGSLAIVHDRRGTGLVEHQHDAPVIPLVRSVWVRRAVEIRTFEVDDIDRVRVSRDCVATRLHIGDEFVGKGSLFHDSFSHSFQPHPGPPLKGRVTWCPLRLPPF